MTALPERRRGGRPVATLLVALAVAWTVACSSAPPPAGQAAPSPAPSPTARGSEGAKVEIDPKLLEPLAGLGPCEVKPKTIDDAPATGALFPDKAVLTEQQANGPLTSIKGYIPMTPVQIRVFYQEQDHYDVIQVEDEIRESEVLLGNDTHRFFVKAQAICEMGSVFLAVLAPESAGSQVPAPAGGGGG